MLKQTTLYLILFAIIPLNVNGQEDGTGQPSSIEVWQAIAQTPEIVDYFAGLFNVLGVQIEETGESITVRHDGDKISLSEGLAEDADFVVSLKLENIANLVSHSADGEFTEVESFRILRVLFTPMTIATLKNPILNVNWRRKLARIEDLTHVYLLDPAGGEPTTHTLIYAAKQWIVVPGLYGNPKRIFRLSPDQAIAYQRKVFEAMKTGKWLKFSRWYKAWRKGVSEKI